MSNKYEEALEKYTYDSGEKIFSRIKNNNKIEEQQDIINMIILWKTNRQANLDPSIFKKLLDISKIKINSLCNGEKDVINQVGDLIVSLVNTKGIRLPMASSILHFYNPDVFPIIDQRAYRELYKKDAPNFTNVEPRIYLDYIKECYKYWGKNCKNCGIKFSDIDKVLYQLDKDNGNFVKGYGSRSGNTNERNN